MFGAHIQDRPQARGVAHARAIRVGIVTGRAVFTMFIQKQIMMAQLHESSSQHLTQCRIGRHMDIGIRHITGCRQQKGNLFLFARGRFHHKGDVVLCLDFLACSEPGSI